MAAIDRSKLLQDELLLLPSSNVLTQPQMEVLNETAISLVGDDDTLYAQVLYKALYSIGMLNYTKSTVEQSSLKREKTMYVEAEYHNMVGKNFWKDWLKLLGELLASIGYIVEYSSAVVQFFTAPAPTLSVTGCDGQTITFN